jgi:hypothetical protein
LLHFPTPIGKETSYPFLSFLTLPFLLLILRIWRGGERINKKGGKEEIKREGLTAITSSLSLLSFKC